MNTVNNLKSKVVIVAIAMVTGYVLGHAAAQRNTPTFVEVEMPKKPVGKTNGKTPDKIKVKVQ